MVVNGADQKHEDYNIHSEISASTGRRSNLFSIAAFAAASNWVCMSFDFEQAFTISKMKEDTREFEIARCPTSEQIADILTKPLQGSQFLYLRDLLLGYKMP